MFEGVTDAQGPDRTKLIRAFGPQGAEDLSISHFRTEGAPALEGISDRHVIIINRVEFLGISCTIGKRRLDHVGMAGNVTLIPAGVEWTASTAQTLDNISISIPRAAFAVAAARVDRPSLTIKSQISGRDTLLQAIVDEMARESAFAADPGTKWHELTIELVDHLAATYGVGTKDPSRGRLGRKEIERINAYLTARLEQPIAIDELAEVVAHSASHFPRLFRRTVGLSPHQYVIRLRLRHALELIRKGLPLADAAICSGFVDQSHLTSWVRRIYGTTPGRWRAGRG